MNKAIRVVAVCSVLSLAACTASPRYFPQPSVGAESPFLFVQMSVPQFGKAIGQGTRTGAGLVMDVAQETNLCRFAIAESNRLRAAFAVITGVLIQTPGDRHQFRHFTQITDELDQDIPLSFTEAVSRLRRVAASRTRQSDDQRRDPDRRSARTGPAR